MRASKGSLANGTASFKPTAAPPAAAAAPSLPTGWEELTTEDGHKFYHEKATGATQWERPPPPPRPPGPKPQGGTQGLQSAKL